MDLAIEMFIACICAGVSIGEAFHLQIEIFLPVPRGECEHPYLHKIWHRHLWVVHCFYVESYGHNHRRQLFYSSQHMYAFQYLAPDSKDRSKPWPRYVSLGICSMPQPRLYSNCVVKKPSSMCLPVVLRTYHNVGRALYVSVCDHDYSPWYEETERCDHHNCSTHTAALILPFP